MTSRNGRSRKLTTVPKIEDTEPINETDGSVEKLQLNEEANEAIAHPLEQPPGDSADAQTPSDRANDLDSKSYAIAHPVEQPPGDSADAQAPSDRANDLDSTRGAIAHPLEQVALDKTQSAANDQQAAQPSAEEVLRAAKAASQQAQEQATESPSSEPSSSEAPQSSGAIRKPQGVIAHA